MKLSIYCGFNSLMDSLPIFILDQFLILRLVLVFGSFFLLSWRDELFLPFLFIFFLVVFSTDYNWVFFELLVVTFYKIFWFLSLSVCLRRFWIKHIFVIVSPWLKSWIINWFGFENFIIFLRSFTLRWFYLLYLLFIRWRNIIPDGLLHIQCILFFYSCLRLVRWFNTLLFFVHIGFRIPWILHFLRQFLSLFLFLIYFGNLRCLYVFNFFIFLDYFFNFLYFLWLIDNFLRFFLNKFSIFFDNFIIDNIRFSYLFFITRNNDLSFVLR